MQKNRKIICCCILGSIFIIILLIIIQNHKQTTYTSSNIILNTIKEISSNDIKKISWGIKRNKEHEQPDVGNENKKILEENEGICMGKSSEKNIYLTFDCGYEAGYTEKILDILKENNVKATFFITSHYLNTASNIIKRMIDEEHIVGNHTVNHKSMPIISDEEIEKEVMQLHQAVFKKFNYEMKYIRPPKGEFNIRTLKKCQQLGYKTVMWSFAYCDWDEKKQPSIEKSKKMIIDNLHPGEIMLLHSNSETNSEILDTIIKEIINQGYKFKSLDQFE